LVRRLATAPGFRRLTRVAPLLRLSFALRGALVRSPLRFALNELRPGEVTASYRLREGGVSIVVRHHTPDVLVLDEVFSQREYDFPPPVEAVLADLPRPPKILDLGANIGLFGAFVLTRFPNPHIVALEPDPANAEIHERAIEANGNADRWTLVQAAAATAPGTLPFSPGGFTRSHAAEPGREAIEVPAEDVLPRMAEADLVKIDVEGAEWALLADPRFIGIGARAVVLEYHPENCPGPDPREEAERALSAAGFQVAPGPAKPAFGTGVLWAWRQRHAQSRP
jgi:FkbM family methyltransferase